MGHSRIAEHLSNKKVSVVIVTRGVNDYLWLCLCSLQNQTYAHPEIIVIDNTLNQNFSHDVRARYPQVQLYSAHQNLFYCQALNKGIELSGGEYILCLNDDVVLEERFIEKALGGFAIDCKVGMVSGKVMRFDRKTIDSTGLFLTLWRTAKERGYGVADIQQFENEGYIFGVNGAVAFYRRTMLEEIKLNSGYFDDDYHIFYEDLDIAWRAQNCGWKAYYVPGAIAYHARGGTVRTQGGKAKSYARRYLSTDLHFDLIKNRYLTIIRNESFLGFILHLPFILAYDGVAWTYAALFKPLVIKRLLSSFKFFSTALRKKFLQQATY